MHKFWQLDQSLFYAITESHLGILKHFFIFLSSYLAWIYFVIPAAVVALLSRKKKWISLFLALVLLVLITDFISFYLLKDWFARLRPCHAIIPNYFVKVPGCGSLYGFPSNHSANSMVVASFIYFLFRKPLFILGIFLSFAIGFSRIYVGVHYPSDVVGGFLVGATIAYLAYRLFKNRNWFTHMGFHAQ